MKTLIINHAIQKHLNSASYRKMMRESPTVFTEFEIKYRIAGLMGNGATEEEIDRIMKYLPYRAKYFACRQRSVNLNCSILNEHFVVERLILNWFQALYYRIRSRKVGSISKKYGSFF